MPRGFSTPTPTARDLQAVVCEREHAAVRHILSATPIERRTRPYVLEGDFDWAGLERETETMSGGEGLLVTIAYELWHAEKLVGLWEIANRLDAGNFGRVLEALRIYRGAAAAASLGDVLSGRFDEELAA